LNNSHFRKITLQQIKTGVQNIIRQIHLSNFHPDYIVGITRGGLMPALMISHYLKVPMYTLDVSLRDDTEGGPESNAWMAADAFGILESEAVELHKSRWDITKRKKILIVEDINDSGATLQWIKDDWQSGCFPDETSSWNSVWDKNVKFAVIVNNESSDFDDVAYHALTINKIETPELWVDFPWESWWLD